MILKAQGEYWHAGHLAELLIEADHCIRRIVKGEFPTAGFNAAAIRKCKIPEEMMRLVRSFVRDCAECRPDLGERDPVLAAVNKEFEELCASCVGRKIIYLVRRIDGKLLDCVTRIQNWIVTMREPIAEVTGRRAFEWLELVATLNDANVPLDGVDGRHARLRRVVSMLDNVVAVGDACIYDLLDERELNMLDRAEIVGIGIPVDSYTVLCETIEPQAATHQLAQEIPTPICTTNRMTARDSDGDAMRPRNETLETRPQSKLAYWCGKRLNMNSHADFTVLSKLLASKGVLVLFVDLLREINDERVTDSVQKLKDAPPEVKDAVAHIRRAFKQAGCCWKIENVRGQGYRLTSPDE